MLDVPVVDLVFLNILHKTQQKLASDQKAAAQKITDTYVPKVILKAALVGHSSIHGVLPEDVLDFEPLRVDWLLEVEELMNRVVLEAADIVKFIKT